MADVIIPLALIGIIVAAIFAPQQFKDFFSPIKFFEGIQRGLWIGYDWKKGRRDKKNDRRR